MFFVLSKIIWAVIAPVNFLLLCTVLCIAGLLYARRKWLRASRIAAMSLALFCIILFCHPVGNWALYTWERQFPVITEKLPHVDGIIILGGGIDPFVSRDAGQIATTKSVERLLVLPKLLKQYPQAKIVYSGGSGYVREQNRREADTAASLFREWDLPTKNIIFERDSRNTFENAVNSQQLVHPTKNQTWLLVTSAYHMPRSKMIFDSIGWNVTPYPVDFRARADMPFFYFNAIENFENLHVLVHEAIGVLIYRFTGKAA